MMGLYTSKRILPWSSKEERERVHELAHRLGIYGCLHHHIVNISGGQRQRAFLGVRWSIIRNFWCWMSPPRVSISRPSMKYCIC